MLDKRLAHTALPMEKEKVHIKEHWEGLSTSTDGFFGYYGVTPSWLQWLNNPWCFLVGIVGLTYGQGKSITLSQNLENSATGFNNSLGFN